MKLRFTKMQGAGNDFVMLDATRATLELSTEQYRALADRHFGVGGLRRLHHQDLVGADPEAAIGQAADLLGSQAQLLREAVQHHEVVARSLHLGEAQSHGAILRAQPRRRGTASKSTARPADAS